MPRLPNNKSDQTSSLAAQRNVAAKGEELLGSQPPADLFATPFAEYTVGLLITEAMGVMTRPSGHGRPHFP